MKNYITFTRKGLFALLAIIVVTILICSEIYASSNTEYNAKTNADRINFIKGKGYTVLSEQPESKTVTLPECFSQVYSNYNDIQLLSGYDLSNYKGCEVVIYTYKINAPKGYTEECVINIIVYNNRVIGGDVSSVALGGFMLPINNQSE